LIRTGTICGAVDEPRTPDAGEYEDQKVRVELHDAVMQALGIGDGGSASEVGSPPFALHF